MSGSPPDEPVGPVGPPDVPEVGEGGEPAWGGEGRPEGGEPPGAEPPPEAAREAGCIAGSGALLFPVLAWAFVARTGMGLPDALLLSALVGLLPALAVAQVPLAVHAPLERTSAYAGSAAVLVVLGAAALGLGWRTPGPEAMGLVLPPAGAFLAWTGGLLAAAAAIQGAFLGLSRVFGWEESPLLKRLLPRTAEEKRAFAGISLVAGFGEELAYRGYAIPVLAPVLGGPWAAAAFTSAVFGLLHAYQGVIGIARTAVFGGTLAAAFLLSGSLWPAVVAHFLVNLVVGVWLAERWL